MLLASVLALSSADTAAVGADAGPLKHALALNFVQVGMLVALPALAGAVMTVPVGALSIACAASRCCNGASCCGAWR